MKPFNLEAAKAGAPFHVGAHGNPALRFVGEMTDGSIAYEFAGCLSRTTRDNLHMMPREVEGAVNIYRGSDGCMAIGLLHPTYSIARARGMRGGRSAEYIGTAAVKWEE